MIKLSKIQITMKRLIYRFQTVLESDSHKC